MFQNGVKPKNIFLLGFFLFKRFCGSQSPPKNVKILLQILNPVTDTEILAPELVGAQIEMVVRLFFTNLSC